MPKYQITLHKIFVFDLEIEATDRRQAERKALEKLDRLKPFEADYSDSSIVQTVRCEKKTGEEDDES